MIHGTPLAEAAIARDIEEEPNSEVANEDGEETILDDSDSDMETLRQVSSNGNAQVSMVGSYRRTSFTVAGPRAALGAGPNEGQRYPTRWERQEARREERSLLRDNHLIPPKHPRAEDGDDHKRAQSEMQPNECTRLLPEHSPSLPYGGQATVENLERTWQEAVLDGKIQTTWQREAKVLARYSGPLVLTFLLQYSLTVASIFTVGHLGTVELAAVSLATMTANITGYAIYQGCATSLDTLCAQAYGSGRKKLVGLQTQRMVYFLWAITVPIGAVWLSAEALLQRIVPEADVARLAGVYLKIVLVGAPGYACYESMKRYLQAQGIFSASLYVLLFCAPLNALLHWLFVWVSAVLPSGSS